MDSFLKFMIENIDYNQFLFHNCIALLAGIVIVIYKNLYSIPKKVSIFRKISLEVNNERWGLTCIS